jgi:glycosyltransferase involved in cell wall biosynthesis
MKRIAVIGIRGIPANYGGLETCADEVCRRWAAEGHDVLVYCRSSRYPERVAELDGVKLRYVPSINRKSLDTISHTFFCVLDLLVNRREYKSIHLYNTGNAIFVPFLKLFRRDVVLSGDGIEWKRQKWGRLAKWVHKTGEYLASRFVDHIVVDNDEVGAYYREKHSVDTVKIAYGANQIEADPDLTGKLMSEHGLEPGRYFLFVGRIVPEKGVDRLIAAYKRLSTDMPLVIIGDDDPNSEYRNTVFAMAEADIRFLGFVYDDEYEQLLVNAYMYISASSLEGTSPSLLSAMGAGVCALVNGIPENRATVKGAIEVYAENDEDDLVRRWQAYIDSPELAAECASAGLQCVASYYSWDSVARDYLELFPEVNGAFLEEAGEGSRHSVEQ